MRNTVGLRLVELRLDRGLSQRQVAAGIDMTQAAISRWEHGTQIPDAESLMKLCEFFDVSADYLIGLVDEWGNPTPSREALYARVRSTPSGTSAAFIHSDIPKDDDKNK